MDNVITRWINAAAGSSAQLDAAVIAVMKFGVPVAVLCVILLVARVFSMPMSLIFAIAVLCHPDRPGVPEAFIL